MSSPWLEGMADSNEMVCELNKKYYSELDWFSITSLSKAMVVTLSTLHYSILNVMSYIGRVVKLMSSLPLRVCEAVYFTVALRMWSEDVFGVF